MKYLYRIVTIINLAGFFIHLDNLRTPEAVPMDAFLAAVFMLTTLGCIFNLVLDHNSTKGNK